MQLITTMIDIFIHLDKYLLQITTDYGLWTYLLLFIVIFCETGLVITPFLPGDSLLFAAGAIAALGGLSIEWVLVLLIIAAVGGDTVNYWVGHYIGPRAFSGNIRFLKKEYLDKTHRFYEKHGGKTIILARFIPIIRTFAPFVAGIGAMDYPHFISYNAIGGTIWVLLFTVTGYFFGNLPVIQHNFSLVALAIIFISILPMIIEFVKSRLTQQTLPINDNLQG